MVQYFATILPPVPASHMMISYRLIKIREEDERKKEKEIESE